ncbi:MAG: hypothetical protein QOE54_6166 [Streptosporangiaceae bacterium]|nr:hypothetical protein [Streptosporangiaceae bacterium]
MPRRRPHDLRAGRRRRPVRNLQAVQDDRDWIALRVFRSSPPVLRGVHILIEVNGVPLLNSFDDGYSHVVGVHPEPFFAPGSALFPDSADPAFLAVGDPIDCQPECCGVGVRVWRHGDRVHWRLIGDRWNRHLLSAELAFDREEYLFTIEWARDAWAAQRQ